MNDYNVLAKFLTDKYINRVSGRDFSERIVGNDPEKIVMAGTMAEDRNEETFEGGYQEDISRQFESIPSISLSFHIDKNSARKSACYSTWIAFLYSFTNL